MFIKIFKAAFLLITCLLLNSCAQIEPEKSRKKESKPKVVIDPYKKMQPKQSQVSDAEREAFRESLIKELIIAPMKQNSQTGTVRRGAWTASARGVNNCQVTNITQRESNGGNVRFSINYSCVSKSGYAGSSGVGDLICGENLSNETRNNNFIARCE
jgi:hypothetical protein